MTDVWKWEIKMCCSLHIQSLLKLLQKCQDEGDTTEICVCPNYGAAPHDELLFDSVVLQAKSMGDGEKIEISGTVTYWSPGTSFWEKSTTIRSFASLDECMTWLKNERAASEECADILGKNCRR